MSSRTVQQLIQSIAPKIAAIFGNNPLADPTGNQSNNLVKLVTAVMCGQAELEKRFESYRFLSRARYLEGDALDHLASKKCLERLECVNSKALLVVSGEDCAVLQQGSTLFDKSGREWIVENDITLTGNGSACAFGVGVVVAKVCGCWTLRDAELSYDNTNTPQIFTATNSTMLVKGGEFESDDSLRDRIRNTGPLHLIQGTQDNLISALMQLDGVNFARAGKGDFCGTDDCNDTGAMIVVNGGLPNEVCSVISDKAPLACNLVGNTECDNICFNGIRFQRPCPVQICVEITLNCDCPVLTQDQAISLIQAQSARIASQSKISASNLSKLHRDIEQVRLRIKRPLLAADCGQIPVIIDPLTGDDLAFETENPNGLCRGVSECENDEQPWLSTLKIPIYEFGIIGEITFTSCIETDESECITCD